MPIPVSSFLWATFLTLFLSAATAADIPIKGGCSIGKSQATYGLDAAVAERRIRDYANLYNADYSNYKDQERRARSKAYSYMELKSWTQEEVLGFIVQQRELLYISVGGELALGKIGTADLPGYVAAIERKVYDLEVELGCTMPASSE
jgi:hypothetical protein